MGHDQELRAGRRWLAAEAIAHAGQELSALALIELDAAAGEVLRFGRGAVGGVFEIEDDQVAAEAAAALEHAGVDLRAQALPAAGRIDGEVVQTGSAERFVQVEFKQPGKAIFFIQNGNEFLVGGAVVGPGGDDFEEVRDGYPLLKGEGVLVEIQPGAQERVAQGEERVKGESSS